MEVLKHIRSRFGHLFEDVCGFIIRPERAQYTIEDLGPSVFRLGEGQTTKYKRTDIDLVNMRGMTIKGSWFEPYDLPPTPLPCVVYLHGNCGCRWDGLEVLFLLKHGFTLFVYDACGSGNSDGKYVSLGFYERQDLAAVVEYLQHSGRVRAIGLWGRSMGAVTSIMFAAKDPSIECLIGDSPFSSLRLLCTDLVEQHGSWVPGGVVKAVVNKIRKRISKLAGFDINDLDGVKYARSCDVPAFLFHGAADTFVKPQHSILVTNAYRGSCLHKIVDGDHNSRRGADALDTAVAFLRLYLVDKVDATQERRRNQKEEAARILQLAVAGAPSPSVLRPDVAAVVVATKPPLTREDVDDTAGTGNSSGIDDDREEMSTRMDDLPDDELLDELARVTIAAQEESSSAAA